MRDGGTHDGGEVLGVDHLDVVIAAAQQRADDGVECVAGGEEDGALLDGVLRRGVVRDVQAREDVCGELRRRWRWVGGWHAGAALFLFLVVYI